MLAFFSRRRQSGPFVVGSDATTVTLGWDPIDCDGYRFVTYFPSTTVTSHTWDGARTRVRVSKNATRVLIEPFSFGPYALEHNAA